MDVLLPTKDKIVRLRVVSTAPQRLKVLLYRLGLLLPNRPKIVEKLGLPPLSPLSHEVLKW